MFKDNVITGEHYKSHVKLKEYRSVIHNSIIDVKNISSSTDFSDSSEKQLVKKTLIKIVNMLPQRMF